MDEAPEKLTLTAEQLATFFAAAEGTRFDAFFVTGTATRPQEILGIKWSDLELPSETDPEAFGLVRLR